MKQSSILKRLQFFFLFLVFPVIVIGFSFQWYSLHSIRTHTISSAHDRVNDQLQSIDEKFLETNTLAASLLTNSRVRRISNPNDPMSTYERMSQVNFIRDTLYNIQLSNSSVSNICLHLPLLHLTYNPDNAYDYPTQTAIGSSTDLSDDEIDVLLSLCYLPEQLKMHNGNFSFVQYSSWTNPHIIVETVYSIPGLEELFEDTRLYPNSYYLLQIGENFVSNLEEDVTKTALTERDNQSFVHLNGTKYCLLRFELTTIGATYLQLIPTSELFPGMEFSVQYCILYTAALLLFALLFAFTTFRIIKKPIDDLSATFIKLRDRHFDIRIDGPNLVEFVPLYDSFNEMAEQLDELIQKEFQQTLLLEKAQLKQLQAQINPHFLYNSFFTLNQMIARDMKEPAKELSRELGVYFRFLTRNTSDEVPLSDEYEHARVYADIQGFRFDGRIKVEMDELDQQLAQITVPRLILQPLLENAFGHGLKQKIRGGLLKVTIQADEELVHIFVEDNGEELSDAQLETMQEQISQVTSGSLSVETTGLLNIARRLQLYFSIEHALTITRSPLGGLKITLTLPRKQMPAPPKASK